MTDAAPTDRRTASKERSHRAIIDAAAALIRETGGAGFTVDQLAARADVARRTVFNHFASVEDVLTAVCVDVLGAVVDDVATDTSPAPADSLLDELASALRAADLDTPLAYLTRVVGPRGTRTSPGQALLVLRAASDVSERLVERVARRHPEVDRFDIELLVASLIGGLAAVHRRWAEQTGASEDDASRQAWTDLVDRMIDAHRASVAPCPSNPLDAATHPTHQKDPHG